MHFTDLSNEFKLKDWSHETGLRLVASENSLMKFRDFLNILFIFSSSLQCSMFGEARQNNVSHYFEDDKV